MCWVIINWFNLGGEKKQVLILLFHKKKLEKIKFYALLPVNKL